MQPSNLAARVGRWSAQHRKAAIFGWILFVVLAVVVGGKIGQNDLDESAAGSGESKRGDMIVEAAGFPDQARRAGARPGQERAGDPEVTAAVRGRREPARADRRRHGGSTRPLASKDGRSVLVSFELRGSEEQAEKLVEQPLAAVAAAQAAHPDVRVEQFGEVSATKAIAAQDAKDGKQSKLISNVLLLIILLVAFGAVVAAGLPLVLGASAVAATVGLLGPVSQPLRAAGRRGRARGDHRPRRRRGLRDVLLTPRDGGARPRPLGRGRGGGRRRHVGPRGAHLGPDRDDRDGRAAVRRQPDLRRLRHRHDARRRRGDARLADLPARDARVPGPEELAGEGPRALHHQAPPREQGRVARLGRHPHPRPRSARWCRR